MSLRLRESRARYHYTCEICGDDIPPGAPYYRDEPHPKARIHRGATVHYLCVTCVGDWETMDWYERRGNGGRVVLVPSDRGLVEARTEWVDVTVPLFRRLELDWSEVFSLTDEQFESFVAERLAAMQFEVHRVGRTNRKDGGIDIVFSTGGPFPLLGAAQVKHHRSPRRKTGPGDVRDLAGVLATHRFQLGVIVTNTTFTGDARWVAQQSGGLVRLRDEQDLRLWVQDHFLEHEQWRPVPRDLEVCPGVIVPAPVFR